MKRALLVTSSLFLAVFVLLMIRTERNGRPDSLFRGDSFIEGIRIIHKRSGVPSWTLTARKADISRDNTEAALTDIKMNIEDRGLTLSADRGSYNLADKRIIIDGTLVARSDTYAVTTSQVEIDGTAGVLTTEGDVRVEGKNFSLSGRGMKIENEKQIVKILKDVKATFHN